jgi:hypothetical protein
MAAESSCSFGQNVHAPNLGRHPKVGSVFLDANDGRLATNPAFFPGGEFGRENQHQLDVRSLFHAGAGVKKDAIGADVASMSGVVGSLACAHARGYAGGDPGSTAALVVGGHVAPFAQER